MVVASATSGGAVVEFASDEERLRDALARIAAMAARQMHSAGASEEWVRVHQAATVAIAGPRDNGRLSAPWPGEGLVVKLPDSFVSGTTGDEHMWLIERFHTGSHGGNLTCKRCRADMDFDRDGTWVGEHNVACLTAAELLSRWPPE